MRTILILLVCGSTACGNPCVVQKSATVQLNSGLTVVPFAVPVAVPVAVVQNPLIVYGYAYSATTQATPVVHATTEPALPLDAASILTRHCAECHGAKKAGDVRLFSDDSQLLAKLPRQRVLTALAGDDATAATMPPAGREHLTDEEIRILRAWAQPPPELEY